MVEGPGCMLKGQKMKGRMKGKTVRAVAGNAVDRVCVYCVCISIPLDKKGEKLYSGQHICIPILINNS